MDLVKEFNKVNFELRHPEIESRTHSKQQDFLRILLAQMQNEGSNQGINNEHKTQPLSQLASSLQSNQALKASALVGRKVLINSDQCYLPTEGEVKIIIDIPKGSIPVNVSIYSKAKQLVKVFSFETHQSGIFQLNWDGIGQENTRLPAGKYQIGARSYYKNEEIFLKTMISSNVDSVSISQNGEDLRLNLADIGSVTLDQVRQINL